MSYTDFSVLNKHYKALEFDKVLENLSKYACCELSKNACKNIEIYENKEKILYALNLVEEARRIIDDTQSSIPVDFIQDVKQLFEKINLEKDDVYELAKSLRTARLVKNFILKSNENKLSNIIQNVYVDKELENETFDIFDAELNIKDDASEKLKSLRNSYKDNKANLRESINKLLQTPSFCDNLQDGVVSTRDGRTVFQVKASCKNKVQGIVHDISSTGLTYFIEPSQIIPLSNKLRQIEIEIQAEIDRIIFTLAEKYKLISNELIKNQDILTELDVIFAKAKYAIHLNAVSAELSDDKIISIHAMRHPLLVEIKENVVENDFNLGINYDCLLITGANTGGKTVTIKTLGLLVLMTKAGMQIPSQGAKIYPFREVFCDISTEQNLEQGISTFSAHIKNISDILNSLTPDSLVILDELGSGTDPVEGAVLSKAILNYILEHNALCTVTTHLGELKSLKYQDNRFENASVSFDIKTLQPKYNLIIGISGTSNAIDISQELGLNMEIISSARKMLVEGNDKTSKMFLEIEKTGQNILNNEKETKENLKKAKEIKDELDDKLKDIKKTKKKSIESFKKKFQNELEQARGEIKAVVDEIRKEKSIKIAMRSYNRLSKIENAIRQEFSNEEDKISEKFKDLDINSLKIGQSVLICKLNQIAILDSFPDKKGNVNIKIGNIVSKVKLKDLAYTDKKIAAHLKKITVTFDNNDGLLSRLDLRGMRTQDAIEYLDEKLDKASLRGLTQITVIHGFGTGALKSAVNDYLKNSPYVAKFRYGDETEGRDGVVIVDLL